MPSNAQALTPTACRMARVGLSWKLAAAAHVSADTVRAFEQGTTRPHLNHVADLLNALESGGVVFVSPYDGGTRSSRPAAAGRARLVSCRFGAMRPHPTDIRAEAPR
jgi:hypothetical protein